MTRKLRLPATTTTYDYFPLKGGLNMMSPPLTLPPGVALDAINWECAVTGGYRRIAGYERFDGHTEPHTGLYYTLPATITGAWATGNTLTGLVSGATAVILTSNANGFIVTKKTGTFSVAEALQIAAATVATCTAALYTGGATTGALGASYTNLAADVYRADIAAVPGSGAITGVWLYNDVVYAFRNNAGGTAGAMYKSTASGWSLVSLGEEISFTAGNVSVGDGDTLTQGAVTATIARVVAQSGTSPNIVGRVIITGRSGGNFAVGAATSTGGGALTLSGAQTAITLSPGGRYEFKTHNFGGASGTRRMYGCSGVDRGFEFDGTAFVPIATGMAVDKPNFLTVHKKQLFFAFGASVQHSAPGTPYVWSAVLGASEIGLGDDVTGFSPEAGAETSAALLIATRNQIYVLYGTVATDWNLVTLDENSGALAYTLQKIGKTYALDDIGVTALGATANFGNFESATVSAGIQSWITDKKAAVISSVTNRELSQYRLFFSDKYALTVTIGPKGVVGMMPMLLEHQVKCVCAGETSAGSERIYFGSTDGFVYRMDAGSSFDGAPITHRLKLVFNHTKSPRTLKRYRKLALEIQGAAYSEFLASYLLGYGTSEIEQPGNITMTSTYTPSYWDSFVWDAFYWDGQSLTPSEMDLDGSAVNMALLVSGSSDAIYPFTIAGAFVHFSPRRGLR